MGALPRPCHTRCVPCTGMRPSSPPQRWGARAEAEGILSSFLPRPPAQEAALSHQHPAPSHRPHAMSGHGVPGTHAAAGLWPPCPCPVLGWECPWMDGAVWSSPWEVQEPVPPMLCGERPRGAGEVPVPCAPRGGQADGHPQGHFGEVSRGCPEPEVPVGRLGAAGPGLAPGPGRCCRLPNSPAWLGGRCLFWWRPRPRPRAGGGAGCGRRRCTMAGAAAGSPRPGACCALSPGKLHGRRQIHPSAMSPCGPLGLAGKGGAGGVSRLPGIADSVSPSAVLVLGFSLILHGSSTGSCDL